MKDVCFVELTASEQQALSGGGGHSSNNNNNTLGGNTVSTPVTPVVTPVVGFSGGGSGPTLQSSPTFGNSQQTTISKR